MNGLTSFEEVLRGIEVDNDFGDNEQDIKDAIIGRTTLNSTPVENTTIRTDKIETLEF